MSRLVILTEEDQKRFDYPPILSAEARALCFMLTDELQQKVNQLRTPTNKFGFLLRGSSREASEFLRSIDSVKDGLI